MNDADFHPSTEPDEPARVRLIRRSIAVGLLVVVVASITVWWRTRERLPETIRIATAAPGGLYYRLGALLEPHLERRTRRPVDVLVTEGSLENQHLLRTKRADVAILQGGAGDLEELVALTPLYHDVLHLFARRGLGLRGLSDLSGKRIAVGTPRSGMLASALDVLAHYDIAQIEPVEQYFATLQEDPTIAAAIATTGLTNPDLERLLDTGEFELLPIRDAKALAILHPHFETFTIPRGLFGETPPVPPADVETVATSSFLAVRGDAPAVLVQAVLSALYDNDLRRHVPTLIPRNEAAHWSGLPTHPAARSYFQPFGGLDVLANLMESLAALKELLFALGAGLYLAWMRWRRVQEREQRRRFQAGKDRLDVFLEKTIAIERQVLDVHDEKGLRRFLYEVTDLKHRALSELTHESLRGDVNFAIFLQQCGDVIRRIQTKLRLVRQGVKFDDRPLDAITSRQDPEPADLEETSRS